MSSRARPAATSLADRRGLSATLWVAALVATVALAAYQRLTGPTHPVRVKTAVGGADVSGRLPRSHGGAGGAEVSIVAPDPEVSGEIAWRRFPTADPWVEARLERAGAKLRAELPHQPASGKLEYSLRLHRGSEERVIQKEDRPVVIRFRGEVPAWVLLPHVILMFVSLVVGLRALLGAFLGEHDVTRHLPWLLAFLVPGGLVLGPIVQKYAFDAFWTGWPFGEDLTDNKTLATVAGWAIAWFVGRRSPRWQGIAVIAAAALMLAVYLIPHSVRGSQLDWSMLPPPPAAPAGREP